MPIARRRRQLLTPDQRAQHQRRTLDDFDRRHPVGSAVWYWSRLPFGPVRETRIREPAYTDCAGQPCCMVDGVRGGVSIFHVTEPKESQREYVRFVSDPCPA